MFFGKSLMRKKTIKKKLRAITALAAAVLMLSACGKGTGGDPEASSGADDASNSAAEKTNVSAIEVETGHHFDYYWNDVSDIMAVYMKYPYMHLSGEDREAYPKLEKSVSGLMDERKETITQAYSKAVRIYKEEAAADSEYSDTYEVSEKVNVRRSDTCALSLLLDGYSDFGGAHGSPYVTGAVFDTQTGEKLALSDVVTDVKQLPALTQEQLEKSGQADYLYEDLDLQDFFDKHLDTIQWVLDYNGITIYFNPYDIAPFAAGIIPVTISFADHPEFFKEKYRAVPLGYGIELPLDKTFYYDLDGDGKQDSLFISACTGEYEGNEPQLIRINGLKYEENNGIFEIEPMLMHTQDGKNYLYIGQQYPDDFWVYSVYDVSKGTVEKVGTVSSERHNVIDDLKDYHTRRVPTDPQSFVLDTYMQMLGTGYGYADYHVGADGLPVKDSDWYIIENQVEFTMLKDLTVSLVSEDGEEKGKTKLKTGDKVTYYRTDGESWADLKLPDGSIGRVKPVYQDGYRTIDGVDIEKIFDGIMFGG